MPMTLITKDTDYAIRSLVFLAKNQGEPASVAEISKALNISYTFLRKIMQALNKKGLTIILTTHYLEEAERMCNHLALIHHGKVHTSSDMKSLLRSVEKEAYAFDLKVPLNHPLSCDFGKTK